MIITKATYLAGLSTYPAGHRVAVVGIDPDTGDQLLDVQPPAASAVAQQDDTALPQPPLACTRSQLRVQLADDGLLAAVDAFVAGRSAKEQIWWREATEFHADASLLLSGAAAMGQSADWLRDLISRAAQQHP